MNTRIASALAKGTVGDVSGRLTDDIRSALDGTPPVLVMVFASTAQPLAEIVPSITRAFAGAVVLGASTAGEFTEQGDAKQACSAFALAGDFRVFAGIGAGLRADPERAVAQALEGLPREVRGYPHCTALLLLDPLAGNSEEATLFAATMLGDGVCLAGGAAGDDLKMQSTSVACGSTVASDAVVIGLVFSKTPLGVGVCHGHEPISEPLRVTKAEGGRVISVEGRPAWEVWLKQTRANAARAGIDVDAIPKSEEVAFLLRYEAGLAAGSEYKIRAPLSRNDDGSVNFACGVPDGSVIRITESEPERQIWSAREAARRARKQLGSKPIAGAVVFDCICRNLILGTDFANALRGISEELGGAPLAGFETYGEIALDVGDMSGFHNTTTVVLAFPRS